MATEDDNTETEEETEETEEETEETEGDEDSGETKKEKDPELKKAIDARDRAKREARRLREENAALKRGKEEEDKPDPVAAANTRLVRASARTVLASVGITDKDDQKSVLAVLDLSDIDVDDDGPDEEAIEDRVEDLRRIFGGSKQTSPARNVPRTVKGARSTKETQTDPDAARYRRILGGK